MTRLMRLEVLVSFMPTRKCRARIAMLEARLQRWPDELRLDAYDAGTAPKVRVTRGYAAADKRKRVPSAFVNGHQVADGGVPDPTFVEWVVREDLARGPCEWES